MEVLYDERTKRGKFRKWQNLADMIDSRLEVINATTDLIEMEEKKGAEAILSAPPETPGRLTTITLPRRETPEEKKVCGHVHGVFRKLGPVVNAGGDVWD